MMNAILISRRRAGERALIRKRPLHLPTAASQRGRKRVGLTRCGYREAGVDVLKTVAPGRLCSA